MSKKPGKKSARKAKVTPAAKTTVAAPQTAPVTPTTPPAPSVEPNAKAARKEPTAPLVPETARTALDIGSGAGLPGVIVALLVKGPITLIEPRRLRAEFLSDVVSKLDLADRVTIECAKVECVQGKFDVITARAVAALDRLLAITEHLSKSETVWVLPKGKNAQTELAHGQVNWHCDVRVEQSCTDPESQILVLTRVGAKKKRCPG